MGLLARVSAYLGTANMSGVQRRIEANQEYARQLIEAERTYWYAQIRGAVTNEDIDRARHELDHLDRLEAQARG